MPIGTTFAEMSQHSTYLNTTEEAVFNGIRQHESENYWVLDSGRLYYVLYRQLAPTEWTLLYCTDFFSMVTPLLPSAIFKILFYLVICLAVSLVGRKYLARQLASVTRLLDKMSSMQMQLFKVDSADYSTLLDISKKGLVDELTGLSTRMLFSDQIEKWEFGNGHQGAVMFIDLDNLKSINDHYGHEAGDQAILRFAETLKDFEKEHNAITARYGGDEFILILEGGDEDEMAAVGKELCAKMRSVIDVKHQKIPINASIGIAVYPQDGTEPADLICKADLALYSAKHKGKDCCELYSNMGIT